MGIGERGQGLGRRELLRRASYLGLATAAAPIVAACQGPATGSATPTAASTGTAAASPNPTPWRGSGSVVFVDGGGSFQDAAREVWLKPFEQETGVKVLDVFPFDFGKLSTMVQTNNVEWDLVDIPGSRIATAVASNLLEPLDYKIVKTDGLSPTQRSDHAIAYNNFATAIGYDTRKFSGPTAPKSWKDFWDVTKFPGARSLRKIAYVQLEAALMADGVAPDKLYPLDVDRAFKKLDEIKPHVKVWWTAGQQPIDLLTSGEVVMANAFANRITAATAAGAKVDVTWGGGVIASSFLCVPRGSKNRENAMRLLDHILGARAQALITEKVAVAPANAKAYDFVKPEIAKNLPTFPQNVAQGMAYQSELDYWAKNFDALQKRFDEWVAK